MPEEKTMVEEAGAVTAEEKTGKQGNNMEVEAVEPEKKYTDDDVNKIVARKIAAERKKMSKMFNDGLQEELEAREKDLLRRELRMDIQERFIAEGKPLQLLDCINYSSKEECEKSCEAIVKAFNEAVGTYAKEIFRGSTPKKGDSNYSGFKQAFAPPKSNR